MTRPSHPETLHFRGVLASLGRDRATLALLAIFAVVFLVHLGGVLGGSGPGTLSPGLMGVCAGAVLVRLLRSNPARDDDERKFWRNVSAALLLWLGVIAARSTVGLEPAGDTAGGALFPGVLAWRPAGPWIDGAHALVYILLSIAAERQVHRPEAWRPNPAEKTIRWPALTFFVLALTNYLVILPLRYGVSESAPAGGLDPALAFYLSLDLIVALRLATLSRIARGLRWRWIYGALSGSFFLELVAKVSQRWISAAGHSAYGASPGEAVTEVGALAARALGGLLPLLPFVGLALTIGLAHLPWPATADRIRAAGLPFSSTRLGDLAGAGGGATIAWCLFFPTLHVALHRLHLVDPSLESPRETVVMIATAILGLAAWLEQRYQQNRAAELWRDQRRVEAQLRTHEQDLRLMVERQRSRAEVERSEQKFAKAFRASPDGLAIADPESGELIEANPSFCRIFDLDPDRAAGVGGAELGLWADDGARDTLLHRLRREGSVRGAGVELARGEGTDGHQLRLAFELIQAGPKPMILVLARILSESQLASWQHDAEADALVHARAAIVTTDRADRIVSWSAGAAWLFGVEAEQAIGRLIDEPDMPGVGAARSVPVFDPRGQRTAMLRFYGGNLDLGRREVGDAET